MPDIDETKHRIIREAIQYNICVPLQQRTRSGGEPQARLRVYVLVWAIPLIVFFAYLLGPSRLPSTASSPPAAATQSAAAVHNPRDEPTTPDPPKVPETPRVSEVPKVTATRNPPPRPLNRALFPFSVKKIVIDAGHGGMDHGAISEFGVSEKEITLDIALRLRRLLEAASFEVLMTRDTDQSVQLGKRAELANASGADVFVSIHVNSMQPNTLRVLETYFLGATDDPAATKLVAMENRDSGNSLSDYRHLLDRIYMDVRRDESRMLAKSIQTELYQSLKRINFALEDHGVKTAPFLVLTRTAMPAILVEVSCLSNAEEVELLTDADYKESIAEALVSGIRAYADKLDGSDERVANNGRN